jgi:hypothetical protein
MLAITCDLNNPEVGSKKKVPGSVSFTIQLTSSETGFGAAGAALADAVPAGTQAADRMRSTPKALDKAGEGADQLDGLINAAADLQDIWSPLLDKVQVFSTLVGEISEVGFYLYEMVHSRV